MRWSRGEDTIHRLLADRHLERVTGAEADGDSWLARARRTLTTARAATVDLDDHDNAYVLAYDAARQALTALLTHQGLRPTTAGGHYAVEQAVRAQFGDVARSFGTLRRRRNELEYLSPVGDRTSPAEATKAITDATAVVDAAEHLLPHLGIF